VEALEPIQGPAVRPSTTGWQEAVQVFAARSSEPAMVGLAVAEFLLANGAEMAPHKDGLNPVPFKKLPTRGNKG
jgi:hypothetical protein